MMKPANLRSAALTALLVIVGVGSHAAAESAANAPAQPRTDGAGPFGSPLGFVEDLMKKELTRRLGPAARYDVRIDQEATHLGEGRLGPVDVTGYDVQTANGLLISRIDLHLAGTRLGLDGKPSGETVRAQFEAQLTPRDVTRYVRRRAGARLKDLHLEFQRNNMRVRAKPDVMGLKIDGAVEGRPVLRGSRAIDFRAKSASVFGLKVPKPAVNELEKRINPLVDLSGMKLPIQVERLAVRRDGIFLDGMAEWDPTAAPVKKGPRKGNRAADRRDDAVRRPDEERPDEERSQRNEPATRRAPAPPRDDRDAEFRRN